MLYLDLETRSELDIRKVSLDSYAKHRSTDILMCSFAEDDGPIERWEKGQTGLAPLKKLIERSTVIPWNCSFERLLLLHVWKTRPLDMWDAMVHALYAGLPASLKDCNRVPFFSSDAVTTKESGLINKFCKPQKDGSWRDAASDPEDWVLFGDYCDRDVADTRLISKWLVRNFPIPERVVRAWRIDQLINDRGMPVDRLLTYRAREESERLQAECALELQALTGLENPNSPAQLLAWVKERGYPYAGLSKELVMKALKEDPGMGGVDVDD